MSKKDFEKWKNNNHAIAFKTSSSSLKGFFLRLGKSDLRVPEKCFAVVKYGEEVSVLSPYTPLPDKTILTFIKSIDFILNLHFSNLSSKDSVCIDSIKIQITFHIPSEEYLVNDFLKGFNISEIPLTTQSVKDKLETIVKDDLMKLVSLKNADEILQTSDFRAEIANSLLTLLKNKFFDLGISFDKVYLQEISSDEFQKIKQQRIEKEKKAEVEQEYEKKREHFKKQCEEITQWLQSSSVKEILDNIKDNKTREKIYEWIVHNALSPDIFDRMTDESKSMMDTLSEMMMQKGKFIKELTTAKKKLTGIAVACGKKIMLFQKKEENFKLKWSVELKEPIRSVRHIMIKDNESILAGGKKSLFLINDQCNVREYTINYNQEVKGGFNSSSFSQNNIFATHSEIGLVKWNLESAEGQIIFREITSKNETTRAVLNFLDDFVFFASGKDIFYIKPDEDFSVCHKIDFESKANITSLSPMKSTLFISTGKENYGEIYKLDFSEEFSTSTGGTTPSAHKILNKRYEIFSVKPITIYFIPHLLYTTGEDKIYAMMLNENLEVQFNSPDYNIHQADGCEEWIFGLDLRSFSLLFWKTTNPTRFAIFEKEAIGFEKVRAFDIITS